MKLGSTLGSLTAPITSKLGFAAPIAMAFSTTLPRPCLLGMKTKKKIASSAFSINRKASARSGGIISSGMGPFAGGVGFVFLSVFGDCQILISVGAGLTSQ